MRRSIAIALLLLFAAPCAAEEAAPRRGLWISCIGETDVWASEQAMDDAVGFAAGAGFTTLFVQVYRGDQAWFDSAAADPAPFARGKAEFGRDPFSALIEKAQARGIEVHAWINTLTLSKNRKAKLLRKHSDQILTRDQHGSTAVAMRPPEGVHRFYDSEDQLFLEPGDPRVREHLLKVVSELAAKYPALNGIHFDYIRYPAAAPFLPGSRFNAVGLCYGYGEKNVERFREATGIDPADLAWKQPEAAAWDGWRRRQVTETLEALAGAARAANPGLQVSCAVIAAFDRAYNTACQDWPLWLERGTADFVVLMNYSLDSRFVELAARAAIGIAGDPGKIAIGLGAYLMDKEPALLAEQIQLCESMQPRGVVLFDYSALSRPPLNEQFQAPSQ